METPFALNSLPLRQRARWRVRSQVSWHKTCKASALYTIGVHAFFINLRNPIPLQIHESPPFATPDAKSCFCFPSLWQSKNEPYLFQQGYWNYLIFSSITFFCAIFYFSYLCSIPYCSIIFTYASSSACNASPFAQKDRANIEIQNSITVLRILMIPYLYAFLSKSSRNPCAVKYPTRNPAVFAIRSSISGSLPVLNYSFNNCCISSSVQIE